MSAEPESPLDRLFRAGAAALSDSELVALLTGSLESARDLIRDGLPTLAQTDWTLRRRGLPKRSAARLTASLELGRRLAACAHDDRQPVTEPDSLARRLMGRYGSLAQEHLGAVFLDSRHRMIAERVIFVGTVNSALVSTRDVLRAAIDLGAPALILFHNHPSGDPSPSAEDLLFSRKLIEAARLLDVDIVDHIIVGAHRFVSLKQRGCI